MTHVLTAVEMLREYPAIRRSLVLYFERRNGEDAEDLADETVRRLIEDIRRNGPPDNLAARAYAVARNVFREWLRQAERRNEALDEGTLVTAGTGASGGREREAIGALTAEERDILEEYFLDRRTAAEMARDRGIADSTLRVRIFRLRERLRKTLGWDGEGRG